MLTSETDDTEVVPPFRKRLVTFAMDPDVAVDPQPLFSDCPVFMISLHSLFQDRSRERYDLPKHV